MNNSVSQKFVIACLEDHPKSIMMLRLARKRAQELGCDWRSVYIETPSHRQSQEGPRERILRLQAITRQMGGDILQCEGETVEEGLMQLLNREGTRIALVIIGSIESEKRLLRHRTAPWVRLVRVAGKSAAVEVMPLTGQQYYWNPLEKLHFRVIYPLHMVYALAAVGVAYICALLLQLFLPPALFRINDQNVALLFMIACAFVAGRFGLLPGLVASVASFFTVNYYFTIPYQALKLDTVTDILNMVLFLSAAILISLFTSQTRNYAQRIAKRELNTQALFALYRIASDAFSREQALEKLHAQLKPMLEADVAFFLPSPDAPDRVEAALPKGFTLNENDQRALDVCWTDIKTTGVASPFNPGGSWRFEPMISQVGEIGVLGVRLHGNTRMDAWFGKLLTAIADQTATILEHIDLERSMNETRISEEREKLRSMLLSSVSHDFKTPLAGIIGALSVYRSLDIKLSPSKRKELIEAAMQEAQRLDSFITNILDMTRLESGNIRLQKEWHNVHEMVKNVTKRLDHRLRHHKLTIRECPKDIEVCMDVIMTEQVLQNILDNACKYTPTGTRIEIACEAEEGGGFLWKIRDYGTGLPAEGLTHAFDKYARLHKKDSRIAGTGLGLAIGKSVIEMQGGRISAANHPEGGAIFIFSLPVWRHVADRKILSAVENEGKVANL